MTIATLVTSHMIATVGLPCRRAL